MTASELRIGNYIQANCFHDETGPLHAHYVKVYQITSRTKNGETNYYIKHDMGETLVEKSKPKFLKPIPLSAEWLLKFGFGRSDDEECGHNAHKNFGFYYDWHFKRFRLEVDDGVNNGLDVAMEIHYVHQLQNLFFALTGEELKIKRES